MSDKPPSKDEALEALDFIVNVLKEHEKDLDRLVTELGTVADELGETGEFNSKISVIEAKITGLQKDVGSLIRSVAGSSVTAPSSATEGVQVAGKTEIPPTPALPKAGMPVVFQCKQWEDFQTLAAQAQTVAFTFDENEKTIKANALKNNQMISYKGEAPKLSLLLKSYLSRQLQVSDKLILEGDIALK